MSISVMTVTVMGLSREMKERRTELKLSTQNFEIVFGGDGVNKQ